MSDKVKPKTYSIAFDTQGLHGYIKKVDVTLAVDVMDVADIAQIDLRDDPLYPYLEQYVKANPSGRKPPRM